MSFSGTQDKCKACDKTVHFIDLLTADGVPYHKACFKCSHCKGTLSMCSYSSMEGVLYCKPHFEQLFKETGNFSTKFPASGGKSGEKEQAKAPSKVSSMFSGTQDKCASCHKTAYPLEKISVEGEIYHKTCFRCFHGGCTLTPSSYAALDGVLYCKHHFAQLFKEKGSYDHLTQVAMKRKSEDSPALEEAAATVAAEAEEEQGKPDEEQS
ncbi:LIM domain-containing protein PLIM2b-like [Zingiber officinale]|uniref:LIM domain-containing protein PLIM2b-like n=1 Tax=Zingiber officinale TaxID=94328 RepID=UPI001C4D9FA0|nr:LIM domain-containing protein PLIM2b-like [Zingiber officinale]